MSELRIMQRSGETYVPTQALLAWCMFESIGIVTTHDKYSIRGDAVRVLAYITCSVTEHLDAPLTISSLDTALLHFVHLQFAHRS